MRKPNRYKRRGGDECGILVERGRSFGAKNCDFLFYGADHLEKESRTSKGPRKSTTVSAAASVFKDVVCGVTPYPKRSAGISRVYKTKMGDQVADDPLMEFGKGMHESTFNGRRSYHIAARGHMFKIWGIQ